MTNPLTFTVKHQLGEYDIKLIIKFNFFENKKIYDEKVRWSADPKIDSHNEQFVQLIKNAPKPIVRLFRSNFSFIFF